jgi:hypothetical protein
MEAGCVMNTFNSFLLFESKRFVCKRNFVIVLLLLFFLLYFVQTGISQYDKTLKNNEEFKNIEMLKVARYINYAQYGAIGIRMLFSPSPISVFFSNTGIISNMTAIVDTSFRHKIYNSLKGKNGFVLKSFGFTDFSGIILYFGSLIALLYGFESFQHKDYLKFLSSISNYRKVFIYIMVSRMLLLLLTLILLMVISLLLLIVNKLNLSINDYSQFLNFCLVTLLMFIVFFVLGTITSTMKSKVAGLTTLTVIWFVLVFFIPAAIHAVISGRAESMTRIYQLEFEKFKTFTDFEQRALKNEGRFLKEKEIPQSERDLAENYLKNEFRRIQSLETEMQTQMKSNILLYQSMSILFPSTFYFSSTNEISSKGYDNLIDFYSTTHDLKIKFVRYYTNQVFYHNNFSKVKSFIKGDENMYYARSRVPGNFGLGIGILLFYIIVLGWFSYRRYTRAIFGYTEDWQSGLKNPRLLLEKGELRPFYVEDARFSIQMYNLLSGQNQPFKESGFEDKIYIDDKDIVLQPPEEDFFYICRLRSMPGDIKAGSLIKLVTRILGIRRKSKGESGKIPIAGSIPITSPVEYGHKPISQLTRLERGHLLLSLLRHETRGIYLINDIGKGLSINFVLQLKKQMEEMSRDGALIIYLTSDYHPPVKTLRKEETFFNHTTWKDVVGSLEGIAVDEDEE